MSGGLLFVKKLAINAQKKLRFSSTSPRQNMSFRELEVHSTTARFRFGHSGPVLRPAESCPRQGYGRARSRSACGPENSARDVIRYVVAFMFGAGHWHCAVSVSRPDIDGREVRFFSPKVILLVNIMVKLLTWEWWKIRGHTLERNRTAVSGEWQLWQGVQFQESPGAAPHTGVDRSRRYISVTTVAPPWQGVWSRCMMTW